MKLQSGHSIKYWFTSLPTLYTLYFMWNIKDKNLKRSFRGPHILSFNKPVRHDIIHAVIILYIDLQTLVNVDNIYATIYVKS